MPTYVAAGASRGLGVSMSRYLPPHVSLTMRPQLEFVIELLAKENVAFALARSPETSKGLLAIQDTNLHILKADITDPVSLKVTTDISPFA
jgi:hypothetical protein